MTEAKHVYELYIRTTPERLWLAMTSNEFTTHYFGGTVESDWRTGSPYRFMHNQGWPMHYGTIIEADPPRRLVQTFEHDYSEEHGGGPDDVSTVTWESNRTVMAASSHLIHEYPAGETTSFQSSGEGWPMILSGLKTLLETGEELRFDDARETASAERT